MSDLTWNVTSAYGWTDTYRVVPLVSILPRRIDGRWRWGVPHYALQGAQRPEHWITIARAMTPDPLVHVVDAVRAKAIDDYHARRRHAVTEKSSNL